MNNTMKNKLKYTLTHDINCPWLGVHFTLENYERKFKETYESPSSQFRTKKLKQIGNEIKTINTTFSKRTRRGRIRKITREELIHK